MIKFVHKGDLSKTTKFLERARELFKMGFFDEYGRKGVDALSAATPIDTGKTAASWSYEIHHSDSATQIIWTNSNTSDNIPIVVLIQYGHGTRNGGYVQGRDFINPTMRPIFDEIADKAWKEVTSG